MAPPKRSRGLASQGAVASPSEKQIRRPISEQVRSAIGSLHQKRTKHTLEGMARYGLPADKALGVSMSDIQAIAKRLGRNHDLAIALWDSDVYEARMLACFVDEPGRVTPAQIDRWCRDFDNWGICDTACFVLFDRTPHAWAKIRQWSERRNEFEKRAAFALLASLAGHDKTSGDELFADCLPLIERAATDGRNFVKKGVSWALRRVGTRSPGLKGAALKLARRLSASQDPAARWVGKDAVRDLTR
ncbi:MAG: DNA alkylation repair protein [Candidatus Eisenbacteria bacterium]